MSQLQIQLTTLLYRANIGRSILPLLVLVQAGDVIRCIPRITRLPLKWGPPQPKPASAGASSTASATLT